MISGTVAAPATPSRRWPPCTDQSMDRIGVAGSADTPDLNEPVAHAHGVNGLPLAQ